MSLVIFNSQSRQKEVFQSLIPNKVGMYVCGPTVYDSLHLGHARSMISADIIRRYLEYIGYEVKHVQNFTDIDDKIINRALEEHRSWKELTTYYIDEFHEIRQSLGLLAATVYPKATDHINRMLELANTLEVNGFAYVAEDGDLYFDTSKNKGKSLSGRVADDEYSRISSIRMNVKKNPGDFVIWKLVNGGQPSGMPSWPSKWGFGRPGWHLECSAMSKEYLGVPIDIHGGGQDLLFPHHEAEKAQTECACQHILDGRESVRYWTHNGFLTIRKDPSRLPEKMSKSDGNVKWIKDMIWPKGPYCPSVIRMAFLGTHYRSPMEFELASFDEANSRLERIWRFLEIAGKLVGPEPSEKASFSKLAFERVMNDDFNTSAALAVVFSLVSSGHTIIANPLSQMLTKREKKQLSNIMYDIYIMLQILGIPFFRPVRPDHTVNPNQKDSPALVELLLKTRQEVRTAKLYELGDKIRDGLKQLGYEIKDHPNGESSAIRNE